MRIMNTRNIWFPRQNGIKDTKASYISFNRRASLLFDVQANTL